MLGAASNSIFCPAGQTGSSPLSAWIFSGIMRAPILRVACVHSGTISFSSKGNPVARKIAILGAGAIGSSISADLTKAGHDVTVIDQWPAQVEALRTSGIVVQMPDGEVKTPIRA